MFILKKAIFNFRSNAKRKKLHTSIDTAKKLQIPDTPKTSRIFTGTSSDDEEETG